MPKQLKAYTKDGRAVQVNPIWRRRHTTKFNGVSYITQRGAEAIYSPQGKKQVQQTIDLYMANASLIRDALTKLGYTVYGGVNAPYIWVRTPKGVGSWEFFDLLLNKANRRLHARRRFRACGRRLRASDGVRPAAECQGSTGSIGQAVRVCSAHLLARPIPVPVIIIEKGVRSTPYTGSS